MSTTFTPLPEASTADLVADRLRDAILDGDGRTFAQVKADRLGETADAAA